MHTVTIYKTPKLSFPTYFNAKNKEEFLIMMCTVTGETSCTLCPIGTYSDVTGAATCKVCDDSINTDVGQVECEACEKGTRPNSDKSECDGEYS